MSWTPAAFVGGLLFGFSPYVFAHSRGHPNLIFVVLLPVLLFLVDEVLVRQRLSARSAGLILGLVAAAQYGISSELLSDAVILTLAALVVLALMYRRQVASHVRHAFTALGWSLVSFVPLVGYPVWMVVWGPGHLTGPIQALGTVDNYRADLLVS